MVVDLDAVILGGGVAGLWILDTLVAAGRRVALLEARRLGAGQTVASQGIIHGGVKYTLAGRGREVAEAIGRMPARWRACLEGRERPDLRRTRVLADFCWLWHTGSLRSRLGMLGARAALEVRPRPVDAADRPPVLAGCRGVARLDEQVIDPVSLLADLAGRHAGHLGRIDPAALRWGLAGPGRVESLDLGGDLTLRPRFVVLCAGAANADLRTAVGLDAHRAQRRPLRMLLVRGAPDTLSDLAGHCVDGSRTAVTVTSARDSAGRTVWQVGGEVAERGVELDPGEAVIRGRRALEAALPGSGIAWDRCEWTTYMVDRAEVAAGGRRPDDVGLLAEGNVITAWPTKLALAPRLADMVAAELAELGQSLPAGGRPGPGQSPAGPLPASWPRPEVADPPWETHPWTAAS